MKKTGFILQLLCVCILSFNANAKPKYEPECKVSGFDNRTICSTKEYGVFVYEKPTILSSVAFSGLWTSADPDNIGVTISLGDISAIIESISFNVNGEIKTFNTSANSSKSIHMGGTLWKSVGLVVLPVEYVEKMLNSKDIKYRVVTVSKGYREGSFYSEKGVASEPIKTLKGLMDKIKQ